MSKIRQMSAIVSDAEKYNTMTGSKKKQGDKVKHYPDEIDVLNNAKCIELTELQLKLLERNKIKRVVDKEDTPVEVEEILTNPKFFDLLKKEVAKSVAGEEETIHVIGLYSMGRLVINAAKTSYNGIPNDESGVGKDYTTEKTLRVFVPKDDLIIRTRISPTVLNYWHNPRFEPEWTWDGKVLYLKDVSDPVLNSEVMKTFTSDATTATVTLNQMAVDIEVVGKPCIFCTTAFGTPNYEQLRRFSLIPLDSSDEQTQRIKQFQARLAIDGTKEKSDTRLQKAISYLERVKVKVPYAMVFVEKFPNNIMVRTLFGSFIDLIRASAAMFQYQREKDEEGFVLADLNDYENARKAIIKTASNSELIPVSKNQKKILEIIDTKLDKNTDADVVKKHEFWSGKEIAEKVTFISEYKNVWNNLNILANYGFLEKGEKEIITGVSGGDENKRTFSKELTAYRIKEKDNFTLPTKEEIETEWLQDSDMHDMNNISNINDTNDILETKQNNTTSTYHDVADVADVARKCEVQNAPLKFSTENEVVE